MKYKVTDYLYRCLLLSFNSRLDHKKVKVFRILLFHLNLLSMPVCNPYSLSYIPMYLTLFRHEQKKKRKKRKKRNKKNKNSKNSVPTPQKKSPSDHTLLM